jgi:hypothetical protein
VPIGSATEAPNFLSTRDSSSMWSSAESAAGAICKDAACAFEHVAGVKTLDGARFHKYNCGANVLVVIAAGTTFAPAKSQALQKKVVTVMGVGVVAIGLLSLMNPRLGELVLTKISEEMQRTEPEVLNQYRDLLRNRPLSTVEEGQDEPRSIVHIVAFSGILSSVSSMVTYLAPPRFTHADLQRRAVIQAATSFPAPIESMIADFEGCSQETIKHMGRDFYDIFTRDLPLRDDPCFDWRLKNFKPPEKSGWELYAGKADAAASATAAAGTAANAAKEEGK